MINIISMPMLRRSINSLIELAGSGQHLLQYVQSGLHALQYVYETDCIRPLNQPARLQFVAG